MRPRRLQLLLLWLAITVIAPGSCVLAYRGQADGVGLAAESFALVMAVLAFSTAVVFGFLVGITSTFVPTAFVPNGNGVVRLGFDWAMAFAAGYVQYFVVFPALRKHSRRHDSKSSVST